MNRGTSAWFITTYPGFHDYVDSYQPSVDRNRQKRIMTSKGYRDLIIWQKSMDLVDQVYRNSGTFPNQENFGLTSQMRPCAVSIPSNIAEGQSRNSEKEFLRFLNIALGSLAELDTQTEIALRQGFLDAEQSTTIIDQIRNVRKMINGLIKSLKN